MNTSLAIILGLTSAISRGARKCDDPRRDLQAVTYSDHALHTVTLFH
jgi:hypothetical protein